MKEKSIFDISMVIMIAAVILMLISFFIIPFPDWAVRVIGVIMLIDIVVLSYSSIRLNRRQK